MSVQNSQPTSPGAASVLHQHKHHPAEHPHHDPSARSRSGQGVSNSQPEAPGGKALLNPTEGNLSTPRMAGSFASVHTGRPDGHAAISRSLAEEVKKQEGHPATDQLSGGVNVRRA